MIFNKRTTYDSWKVTIVCLMNNSLIFIFNITSGKKQLLSCAETVCFILMYTGGCWHSGGLSTNNWTLAKASRMSG